MRRRTMLVATVVATAMLFACAGSRPVGSPAATPPGPSRSARAHAVSAAARGADWPTYHGGRGHRGVAGSGPALGSAHRLWSIPVDGAVYAEPLVVGGRVIVATENDSVYALDAASGARLWGVHLGTPVSGGDLPCGNIDPSGITGTPVADARRGVVYVVVYKRGFRHVLVALDVASGRVRWQRGIDPPGGDYKTEQQRAALALANGRVYVSYGGLYGDCGSYHGWVLGAAQSGRGRILAFRVPSANEGAIWAAPGPSIDAGGNLYVATGNGSSSSHFDFGDSVIRLTPGLRLAGWFAPSNFGYLSASDLDLGSTSPLLLSGGRVFIIGKTGTAYVLNAGRLGGIGHQLSSRSICDAAFGGEAYSGGTIYVPCTNGIVAVRLVGNQLQRVWRQGAASFPPILAGPGLWAMSSGSLYQLDPATGGVRWRTSIGSTAHFATPAASGGRIFVAAGGRVQAFG